MVFLRIFIIDQAMKIKSYLLISIWVFFAFHATAQELADSVLVKVPLSALRPTKPDTLTKFIFLTPDLIIKTNGNMFRCRVVEVNDSMVVYNRDPKDTTRNYTATPKKEVYAVAYGNGLATVITPELMGKKADINPEVNCEGWNTFKHHLGHGSLNIGVGFVSFYSPIKNKSSYDDEQVMPSVFAGYTFIIKGKLKAGAHLGVGGNELTKSGVSEYDQLKVSSIVEEGFLCLGLFARYDILDGAIKPFVKGGIDFIGVNMTTTSEAESLDGTMASLKTVVHQRSIKPGLILRAGLDLYFGNKFGIYGDVGTGLSLVQVGVLFNFE